MRKTQISLMKLGCRHTTFFFLLKPLHPRRMSLHRRHEPQAHIELVWALYGKLLVPTS